MIYKGKLCEENFEFGVSDFLRKNSRGANKLLNQINISHIPQHVNVVEIGVFDSYTYMDVNQAPTVYYNTAGSLANIIFLPSKAISGNGPYFFLSLSDEMFSVRCYSQAPIRGIGTQNYYYTYKSGSRITVWCDINGIFEIELEGIWNLS